MELTGTLYSEVEIQDGDYLLCQIPPSVTSIEELHILLVYCLKDSNFKFKIVLQQMQLWYHIVALTKF